eukprot:TRINITY_DN22091_c0_g1_i2.p1 TRINITY_DN22091_c0_g1~~TRINITY_DN22091_c0_g1_i2.p1  ORF type:complete len:664 (-),score=109.89 TRINITY_DN22091_c0_g1_i2:176-2116(-)
MDNVFFAQSPNIPNTLQVVDLEDSIENDFKVHACDFGEGSAEVHSFRKVDNDGKTKSSMEAILEKLSNLSERQENMEGLLVKQERMLSGLIQNVTENGRRHSFCEMDHVISHHRESDFTKTFDALIRQEAVVKARYSLERSPASHHKSTMHHKDSGMTQRKSGKQQKSKQTLPQASSLVQPVDVTEHMGRPGVDEKAEAEKCSDSGKENAIISQNPLQRRSWSDSNQGARKRKSRQSVRRAHSSANIFVRITEHHYFEYFSAAAILAHSIVIGLYVHYTATIEKKAHPALQALNWLMVSVFILEVLIKALAEKWHFVVGPERLWNAFDCILVSTTLVELPFALAGQANLKTMLKIAEMIRTLRILRILKLLRFSYELQNILGQAVGAAKSLAWVMLLIFILLSVLAVCVTQGSVEFLDGKQFYDTVDLKGPQDIVYRRFGGVAASFLTFFGSISGGMLWLDTADALGHVGYFYAGLFVLYVAMMFFAILHIISGIFVDVSIQSFVAERDVISEKQRRLHLAQASHLVEMFEDIDEDDSGQISKEELRDFLTCNQAKAYLDSLKLDTSDAELLFRIIDADESGFISIDEFVDGCLRFKGEAKSLDLHALSMDFHKMRSLWINFMNKMEGEICGIHAVLAPTPPQDLG